ncbi:hypothetical protein [Saccharicrinis sp. GN24d3]|uniref:hypothetical protein n=1 Tax=Saccharicrinis sp. GN24d3 TaxID=3458416 RepID=UPI0040354BD8
MVRRASISNPLNTWRQVQFEYAADGSLTAGDAAGVSVQPIVKQTQIEAAVGSLVMYLDDLELIEKTTTDSDWVEESTRYIVL